MNTLADDATERVRLEDGRALGRYRIGRVLGEGGMGVVYEALHLDLRKRVAIKVLKPELLADETAQRRFLREGEAAARVRHPHVVDVSDVGNHAGLPFLVMELLEGEDLETLLRREGRLGLERVLGLILPVVAGVAAGHDRGVIHCDLKPQNIFLSRQPGGEITPKVLDFGVSRLLDPLGVPAHLTAAGAIFGTVQYFAPEQARGGPDVGPRSDQYTLGAILSECLTGERTFPGDNALDILRRICQADFAPPRALRADLPFALEEVILRAMSLEPSARFASLYELGAALLPFSSLKTRLVWEGTFKQTVEVVSPSTGDGDRNPPSSGAAQGDGAPPTEIQPVVDVYDEAWEDETGEGAWEEDASPIAAATWSDEPDPMSRSGQTLLLPPDALVTEGGVGSTSTRRLPTAQPPGPPPAPERARATDAAPPTVTARTRLRPGARHARLIGLGTLGLAAIWGVLLLRPASRPSPAEPPPEEAAARASVLSAPSVAPAPAGSRRAFDAPPAPIPPPAPVDRAAEASAVPPGDRARAIEPRASRASERRAASAPSRKRVRPRVQRTINHAPVVD